METAWVAAKYLARLGSRSRGDGSGSGESNRLSMPPPKTSIGDSSSSSMSLSSITFPKCFNLGALLVTGVSSRQARERTCNLGSGSGSAPGLFRFFGVEAISPGLLNDGGSGELCASGLED